MVNFSIIIPYWNIPDLLTKCIDSIPIKDDIEIIIIDDFSEISIEDVFKSIYYKNLNIKMIRCGEHRGAGYARNKGLEIAKGKWILFADADDYFNNCLFEELSNIENSDCDIVYYKTDSVDLITKLPSNRADGRNSIIDKAIETGNFDFVRYQSNYPIGKFIKHDLIKKYNIRFQEIMHANDIIFSTYCGYYAQKVCAKTKSIYTITTRNESLTYSMTSKQCKSILNTTKEAAFFLKEKGKSRYGKGLVLTYWMKLFRIDKSDALKELYGVMVCCGFLYTIKNLFLPLLFEFLAAIKVCFPLFWSLVKKIKNLLLK